MSTCDGYDLAPRSVHIRQCALRGVRWLKEQGEVVRGLQRPIATIGETTTEIWKTKISYEEVPAAAAAGRRLQLGDDGYGRRWTG